MNARRLALAVLFVLFGGAVAVSLPGCPKKTNTPGPGGEEDDEGMSPPPSGTAISPEKLREVNAVFNNGRNCIQECFQRLVERKKNPKLKGTIIVGVSIGIRAKPQRVWIYKMDAQLQENMFVECVKEKVGEWEFPVLGGKFDLTSPRYFLEVY